MEKVFVQEDERCLWEEWLSFWVPCDSNLDQPHVVVGRPKRQSK